MTIAEKLTAIAENEQKVFDAGKKTEYDAFWDAYQNNGNRTNYNSAFYGSGWTVETFKPKYDMQPTSSQSMLGYAQLQGIDLSAIGVLLDFSKSTNMEYTFQGCNVAKIGVVDTRNADSLRGIFNQCKAHTIEKLILRDDGSQTYTSNPFYNNTSIENIIIEGAIGQNGFNVSTCTKLTHDSLMSIINHLQAKTSGTFVLTLGSTNLAKLTNAEKAIASGKGWTLA